MIRLGNSIIWVVFIMIFSGSFSIKAQETFSYYICSYHIPSDSTSIDLKTIDLDAKAVVESINVPIYGEITFKTPISLRRNSENLFLILATTGEIGKNTLPDEQKATQYGVVNENGILVSTGSLSNIAVIDPHNHADPWYDEIRFDVFSERNVEERIGRFVFDNADRLSFINSRSFSYNEADFPQIGLFKYFKKISPFNDTLYRAYPNRNMYMLRLDIRRNAILDSINLGYPGHHSFIFGLGNRDSMAYLFALNSNIVGFGDTAFFPSYAKIIEPRSLSLIDSIAIQMPNIEGGYIINEIGECDNIGPYMVYYYFAQEDYRYFSPAMLFIFDTRTNEATWLRVGWR